MRATETRQSSAGQFKEFFNRETSGAVVLLLATIVAVAIANSPFVHAYDEFLHTHVGITFGPYGFE